MSRVRCSFLAMRMNGAKREASSLSAPAQVASRATTRSASELRGVPMTSALALNE